ncbi:MAG: hypothetical protein HDR03_11270 [Lachnospiraceae bacterium]|nr:hypothetical protein [Lachnospiraceae bacterium]
MPRRGENIRKRKDGRWEGRYYVQEIGSDRKISHSVYAKTYTDVKAKLAIAKLSMEAAKKEQGLDVELDFCRTAEEWLGVIEHSQKHATYIKYSSIYENHIRKS